MLTEELRTVANAAMRELKKELQKTGAVSFYVLAQLGDGSSKKLDLPPSMSMMLNNGLAKERIFDVFRQSTQQFGVDAWIFGTEAWMSRQTEEGNKHSIEEHREYMDTGFKKLQEMGWVDVFEAIVITAQTATDVLLLKQPYIREKRSIRWVGPPEENLLKQHQFGGRQKMFGASYDDITGYDVTRRNPARPS